MAASPLLVLIALAVKCGDRGPVLFRQKRVGLNGQLFSIVKFRTMVPGAEKLGSSVTPGGDPRVTWVGRILRWTKLDELPQLWNVFRGDMSLVGPRPEVPHYVEKYTPRQRQVLRLKPGVTDLATLVYRNEEELLRNAGDLEKVYVEEVLPRKIELNLAYASTANAWEDTKVILRTLFPRIRLLLRAEAVAGSAAQCSAANPDFSPKKSTVPNDQWPAL